MQACIRFFLFHAIFTPRKRISVASRRPADQNNYYGACLVDSGYSFKVSVIVNLTKNINSVKLLSTDAKKPSSLSVSLV